jgi:hypothetical protein
VAPQRTCFVRVLLPESEPTAKQRSFRGTRTGKELWSPLVTKKNLPGALGEYRYLHSVPMGSSATSVRRVNIILTAVLFNSIGVKKVTRL